MNIIIANEQGIHPNIGGIENVSYNLALEFKKNGYNVYFLSSIKPYKESVSELCITQYYIPETDSEKAKIDYAHKLIIDLNIDIILNQSGDLKYFSSILFESKKATKCKIVSALHFNPLCRIMDIEDSYFISEKLKYNLFLWGKALCRYVAYKLLYLKNRKKAIFNDYRYIYNNSDSYVLLSDKFKKPFNNIIRENNKLYAITNPVDVKSSYILNLEKSKTILFVGRMVRSQKRADRLLKIWSKIHNVFPDWNIIFVGDGPYKKELIKKSKDLSLRNIEFKGHVNPVEYYKKASILCVTSTSEGFGLVLAEAQSHGCIPIAYDSFESLHDIITNKEDGIIVKAFKEKSYVKELSCILSDEKLRNKLIANCLNKDYSSFTLSNVAKKWLNLFENVKK